MAGGIRITKNGRTIPLDKFADEMMADVRKAAIDEIRRRVKSRLEALRCPVHGRAYGAIDVTMKGDQGTVSVSPCCDATGDAVRRAVAGAG